MSAPRKAGLVTILRHLRSNAVGYAALFVALGGTSYAAVNIPRNSVGTRQLRNGAVTSSKLGRSAVTPRQLGSPIAGYVAFWARIDQTGAVIRSSEPATTRNWSTGNGVIAFRGRFSGTCFPLATAGPPVGAGTAGFVSGFASPGAPGEEGIDVAMVPDGVNQGGPLPIFIALICPS